MLARQGHHIALALIFLVALGMRLHGLGWDGGHYLHPDERFIAQVSSDRVDFPPLGEIGAIFDPATSPINPRRDNPSGEPLSYAYGSLPIYVQGTASWLLDQVVDRGWGDYDRLYLVGRVLTAFMDLVTLAFTYLLARRLFGPGAGLIAAGLYAFTVLPIQLSHFFAVDPWLTAFVTGSLYLAVRFIDRPTLGRSLALGALVGCAFATKASVPSLLVPLFAAYGYVFWKSVDRSRIASYAAAGALLSLAVFTLFEPYAIVRSGPFIEDIRTQARIVRGIWDVPFTRQFVGLTPGLYELENLFRFTVGPAFLLAALAGVGYGVWRLLQLREVQLAIPLLWIVAYVPTLLIAEARFLRYSLPLLPVFAVLAAGLLWAGLTSQRWHTAARLATVAAVGVTALWGIGFSTIYASQHPRIAASEWILENIPPGSTLTGTEWDDALPLRLEGYDQQYQHQPLDVYSDLPPEEKVAYFHETLSDVDYIVMSSDRVRLSVDNLPWRYAVQNEFYRRLLAGQLGFRMVYETELQPGLFGFEYDDTGADESFSVYDHPKVRIFEKVEDLTAGEFRSRLLWGINQPWEPGRYPSREWLMLDKPVDQIKTTDDAAWNGWALDSDAFAIVSWLLAVELLGLAALPLSARVFRRSPDRGVLASRLVGLIAVSWLVWIGASIGWWGTSTPITVAMILAVAAVAWGWQRRSRRQGNAPLLPDLRTWVWMSAIYFGIFALFLAFRLAYPDFWQTYLGGEKPFELAYLRAVAASTSFPPYDPWYSDGAINYYYYGWHLISTVAKVSGIGVSNAFQLAIPTIAGLLGTQVALVMLMLARGVRRSRHMAVAGAAILCGLALVVFIGNLDAFIQAVTLRGEISESFDFWGSTRVIDYTINEFPYFSLIWADVHPHVINMPLIVLALAIIVAVVIDLRAQAGIPGEGMSRHSLSLVLLSLVAGTVVVTNAWDGPLTLGLIVAGLIYGGLLLGRRTALVGGLSGAAVALAAFVLFAPFHLGFYSVVEGLGRAEAGSDPGQFLVTWGIFFAVILASVLYRVIRRLPGAAFGPPLGVMLITLLLGGLGLLLPLGPSNPVGAGTYFATLFFAAAITFAAAAAVPLLRVHPLAMIVFVALAAASGLLSATEPSASIALAICSAATLFAFERWRNPIWFVPWALIAAGTLTIAGTEVIYVVDDLQGGPWQRMNTVFKFYLQAWILLGIGSALLLARLWTGTPWRGSAPGTGAATLGVVARPERWVLTGVERIRTRRFPGTRLMLASAATLFVFAGFAYPVFGTPVRLQQDMPTTPATPTLDGYTWMQGGFIHNATGEQVQFTGDLEAIEWLRDEAGMSDVIVEAAIGPYRGNGSRISSATGLPTILGWDRHQRQQRYPEGIGQRMADVRRVYNATDPQEKLELLRRYRARYIIIGDVERLWNSDDDTQPYASAAGLRAFESLLGNGLRLAFVSSDGDTVIYEVEDFPSLEPAAGAVHEL